MIQLFEDDPIAMALIDAVHRGDVQALERGLNENRGLAKAVITRRARGESPAFSYPLVASVADWPGHFPNVAASIATFVGAGADLDAHASGPHSETPLHGAASCDDVAALDALLDAGADIEAPGAVIAGGTALDDAIAFGQWRAARRLVERGARTAVWHAAALGLLDRLEAFFASGKPAAAYPWGEEAASAEGAVQIALWCACHGGQRAAAEYLLARGADPSWVAPWDGSTPLDAARRSGAKELAEWLQAQGAKSASN